MIKNNSISADTQGERIERLTLLSANIADFAVEIGVSGTRLTKAESAADDYLAAIADAGVQAGQTDEAFEEFRKAEDDCAKFYTKAKEHLLAIIWEREKPDEFIEAYGLRGESPFRYPGLLAKISTWKSNHDLLVAALDERVLSAAAMANLLALRDTMVDLRTAAYKEKREADDAYDALHDLFKEHTKLMSFVYTAAILTWGDEDPRLNLLGFLPASEVWTPGGGGEPSGEIGVPANLAYSFNGANVRLVWDAVAGADGYWLSHTMFPPLFLKIYEGADTFFEHIAPDNGTHYYNVRAKVGDEYGAYCEAISVEVVVAPPAPPENLNMILNPDGTTKAMWDAPAGSTYDGCSIYVADVPNGSPAPPLPAVPIWDELIVYSITLGALAPGMTRYVWVTGTKNGAESAPAGPVSVSN